MGRECVFCDVSLVDLEPLYPVGEDGSVICPGNEVGGPYDSALGPHRVLDMCDDCGHQAVLEDGLCAGCFHRAMADYRETHR